jgi:ribonuclease HI
MHFRVHFDGAVSESKLGCDMGIGVAVFINNGFEEDLSKFVGVKGWDESSSNIAEWIGCVEALKLINEYKQEGDTFEIVSDSEIVTNQFNGVYAVNKESFKPYYREAMKLYHKAGLLDVKIRWVPRNQNKEADVLSKKGLHLIHQKK